MPQGRLGAWSSAVGGLEAGELTSEQWLFPGLHHMDVGDDGIGPSTDALYLMLKESFGTLSEDPDEFVIAFGANHQKTGKAMYMNVSLYGPTKQVSAQAINDPKLASSAADYLSDHPDVGSCTPTSLRGTAMGRRTVSRSRMAAAIPVPVRSVLASRAAPA